MHPKSKRSASVARKLAAVKVEEDEIKKISTVEMDRKEVVTYQCLLDTPQHSLGTADVSLPVSVLWSLEAPDYYANCDVSNAFVVVA